MEPDQLAAIAKDEQRAVIAVNEECLAMQGQALPVPPERRRPNRYLRAGLVAALLILLAVLVWWFTR